ncbi:MAG: hypothetical protein QM702_05165 [Rubrivivax sp.]
MDGLLQNVFIDIALAFALTYALLSLLVMKVQETWHGNLLAGRVHNLHRLLNEALMGDEALVRQLLENPLLFALYTADKPRQGLLVVPARGPSEIPPDLFARALLMELNPSLKPPREDHASPAAFVDALDQKATAQSARSKLLRALRGLLPGHEGDWDGFEAAIAAWFMAIGDRSKGWWKRRSSLVGFWIAFFVCALLNVDAWRIASAFGDDAELRGAFARVAEGVQDVREQDARAATEAASVAAAPGTTAVVTDPQTRAVSRMVDAIARLRAAFDRDKAIRGYGFYASDLKLCGADVEKKLLPERKGLAPDDEGRYLSNADTWQRVLPFMLSRIESASGGVLPGVPGDPKASEPAQALRVAHRCVVEVSAWVRAAARVSNQAETQRLISEAAVALEDTKSALLALIRSAESGLNARRLFAADPEAYADCARAFPATLVALQQCVRVRQNVINRLPIGPSTANLNAQFCRTVVPCDLAAEARPGEPAACESPPPTGTRWLCSGEAPAVAQLSLPPYRMQFRGLDALGGWLAGVLISAFFVSLGAPFWFDLLSKVVRVRASVAAKDDLAATQFGEGTKPLPTPPPTAAGAPPPARRSPSPGGQREALPRVVGSDSAFEDRLTVREVQALQQALGVKATGELDDATRASILAACRERGLGDTSTLTAVTYATLVGRPASQARQLAAGLPSGRLRKGEANPLVPLLVKHLSTRMAAFGQPIDPNATALDDNLRALCVLWAYKTDGTTPLRNRKVFRQAIENPKQFDEVTQELLQRIADPAGPATLARDPQAWMDWAIGELGQVEADARSRATSNPRVCEYLDAIAPALGSLGDHTAWCGAFVTWVLKQYVAEARAIPLVLTLPPTPEGARNWINWPGAAAGRAPQPGDVAVVNTPGGKHHVGFVLESEPATGEIWLVGGNQNQGTCVCRSRFLLADVAWAAPPF